MPRLTDRHGQGGADVALGGDIEKHDLCQTQAFLTANPERREAQEQGN
jgi:hypothetical protein